MSARTSAPGGLGLIIIGTEILDGRRADKHFEHFREQLVRRHFDLAYSMVLRDRPEILVTQLRWAMSREEPFFCCGGIGATPDDYTRQCAAEAGGTQVTIHPEGAEILRRRWGKKATPARMGMVEFPEGSTLIPNPFNRVPGFTFHNGHFLPGFPEMAHPMMEWVLDECYEQATPKAQHSLRLPGSREADITHLMEVFTDAHPQLAFSCLPKFTETGTEIELSVTGPASEAVQGLNDLIALLEKDGIDFARVVS